MLKYSLILIGIYILYYAGIILYDLFLKKEKVAQTELTEEFTLGDFAEANTQIPNTVEIEDVENLRTPKSYSKSELPTEQNAAALENYSDLEELRKKFEAEEDLDGIPGTSKVTEIQKEISPEVPQETSNELDDVPVEETEEMVEEDIQKELPPAESNMKKNHWNELLNLSHTAIKMVANYEGQKVYHSLM